MRVTCERCGKPIGLADVAFICSYECTFCEACANSFEAICPNCQGELVRRPRRQQAEPPPAA
jgi:uncharacterized protein